MPCTRAPGLFEKMSSFSLIRAAGIGFSFWSGLWCTSRHLVHDIIQYSQTYIILQSSWAIDLLKLNPVRSASKICFLPNLNMLNLQNNVIFMCFIGYTCCSAILCTHPDLTFTKLFFFKFVKIFLYNIKLVYFHSLSLSLRKVFPYQFC